MSRRKFETLSLTDQLTGHPNRRAGMEALEAAWKKRASGGPPVNSLMLDIDHFKQVNDRYGHAAGDRILIEAGNAWASVIRKGDLLCRSGGEEFLVVTTGTDIQNMAILGYPSNTSRREERIHAQLMALKDSELPGFHVCGRDE